jgi:DNA-binding transcriptional ArsR family regulator
MNSRGVFQIQARLCKAMSHPLRLELLHDLREAPKHVGELAELVGQPQSTVSRHLSILRSAGIVLARHDGQSVYNRIANPKLFKVCDLMRETLEEQSAREARLARQL